MKKIISIVLALTLVLTLAACGVKKTNNEDVNDTINTEVSSVEDSENNAETKEDAESNVEWKQFLNEYEEWVDKYIEITKKYKDNPSDMSILSDYTDMMSELTEWTTKTEDMEKELENASPTELAEYSAELARIAAKLANAAY